MHRFEYLGGVETLVGARHAFPIRDRRVLDVGAGQRLTQLAYFSRANDAVGIDLEVIAQGFDLRAYARMLRLNGLRRTAKTVARKALLIDARYRSEVARQLGLKRFPRLKVLQMDVSRMAFPDSSFDFVFSYSVFHHLPDPAQAFREVARVLRPGGVAYVSFQLFTSATGCLDPRFFPSVSPRPFGGPIPVAVLIGRPTERCTQPTPARRVARHHRFDSARRRGHNERSAHDGLAADLAALREEGELADYSDEELLANEIVALGGNWSRPPLFGDGASVTSALSATVRAAAPRETHPRPLPSVVRQPDCW